MPFDTFSRLSLQAQSTQALTQGTLLAQHQWTEAQVRLYQVPTGTEFCFVEVGYGLPNLDLISLRSFTDPSLLISYGWNLTSAV